MPPAEKYGDSSSYYLTAQQADLLFAAFNSNNPADQPPVNQAISQSPESFTSPVVDGMNGFHDAPLQDGDEYQFGDSSFDFGDITNGSEGQMVGDMPGTSASTKSDPLDNESHDKRSYPDDEDEDEMDNVGGAKRRESSDKVAKKPGRKPLTTEPTSVRCPISSSLLVASLASSRSSAPRSLSAIMCKRLTEPKETQSPESCCSAGLSRA